MGSKLLVLLAASLAMVQADTTYSSSPHYHSSLGSLRSCQRTSGGYAVSSEPGVYRHEYSSQYVPASSSSYRVVESRPVETYYSSSHSRPVIYESSVPSSSYTSYQSGRPVIYESSAPVSSGHSRTVTTYTQYENPAPVRVSYSQPTYKYYSSSSGASDGHVRYEYPATNVRYTSGSSGSGCTRCAKKKK